MGVKRAHIKNVSVFCASRFPKNDEYAALVEQRSLELGKAISQMKAIRNLYYGGGVQGVMGAIAKGAGRKPSANPSFKIRAVNLALLKGANGQNPPNVREQFARNIDGRKNVMIYEADAILIPEGGIGTLEEVLQVINYNNLLRINPSEVIKYVIFINEFGIWDNLKSLLDRLYEVGLADPRNKACMAWANNNQEAINLMNRLNELGPICFDDIPQGTEDVPYLDEMVPPVGFNDPYFRRLIRDGVHPVRQQIVAPHVIAGQRKAMPIAAHR